jgi:hypothetical protein
VRSIIPRTEAPPKPKTYPITDHVEKLDKPTPVVDPKPRTEIVYVDRPVEVEKVVYRDVPAEINPKKKPFFESLDTWDWLRIELFFLMLAILFFGFSTGFITRSLITLKP